METSVDIKSPLTGGLVKEVCTMEDVALNRAKCESERAKITT